MYKRGDLDQVANLLGQPRAEDASCRDRVNGRLTLNRKKPRCHLRQHVRTERDERLVCQRVVEMFFPKLKDFQGGIKLRGKIG